MGKETAAKNQLERPEEIETILKRKGSICKLFFPADQKGCGLPLGSLTSGRAIYPALTTGKVKPLKSNICLEGVKALQLQGTIGRANQLVARTRGSAGQISPDQKRLALPLLFTY